MTQETSVLPLLVEILTRSGWSPAGYYAIERADKMVALVTAEGAIARAGGDVLVDTRLEWKQASPSEPNVQIGSVDDMLLFTLYDVDEYGWTLQSSIPGDVNAVRKFDAMITATDAAERLLARFIARIKAM